VWLEESDQRMQGMTLEDEIAELKGKIRQYEEWLVDARAHNKQRDVTKYINLINLKEERLILLEQREAREFSAPQGNLQ
jgi:hypothetical protein